MLTQWDTKQMLNKERDKNACLNTKNDAKICCEFTREQAHYKAMFGINIYYTAGLMMQVSKNKITTIQDKAAINLSRE